jgi:ornithine cyclodeaminase
MKEVIEHVGIALQEFSSGRTITPIRTSLPFGNFQNTALVMPSIAEELNSLGLKLVTVVPGNQKVGKKMINGVVILFDFETGEPVALLEGSYLTKIRTGALSGVATKYLSRQDSKVLTLIGTGEQAIGLLEAVLTVRDIEKVILYNRTEQKAHDFANYISEKFCKDVQVYTDPNQAVREADIIITATNSPSPVFSEPLRPGVHINAVGSFRPEMQELPSYAISSADKVIVESTDAALEETGDLQMPIHEGSFSSDQIYAELGEIVSGEKQGRENDKEITVFKSVGLAVVDIIVAKYVYEQALKSKAGISIQV